MEALWIFALYVLAIVVVPGMDMGFVLSSALADGRQAGLAAVAGIVAGGVAHVAMGVLGVGLLLKASPAAFDTVLAAGALYLAWIGWSLWRQPATLTAVGIAPSRTAGDTFARGLATCLLNPKAYIFMIAVLPQFVHPARGGLLAQALAIGIIVALTQALVYGGVALGAAALRVRLAHSAAAQATVARCAAVFLMAAAAWTAWQAWSPA